MAGNSWTVVISDSSNISINRTSKSLLVTQDKEHGLLWLLNDVYTDQGNGLFLAL